MRKTMLLLFLSAFLLAGGKRLYAEELTKQEAFMPATPSDYSEAGEGAGSQPAKVQEPAGPEAAGAEVKSLKSAPLLRAGSFGRHIISAELVNGSTLRLNMDIQMWDMAGGSSAYPSYMLSPVNETDFWTIFRQPWLVFGKTASVNYGKLNTISYTAERSSSGNGDRYLEFKGSWEIGGEDLERLKEISGSSFTMYRNFGSYNLEIEEAYSSMNVSELSVSGISSVWKMLNCTHQYVYECESDDHHIKKCSQCGHVAAEEAHKVVNGKCSLCGKVFTVKGRFVYQLNGKKEYENYELMPGSTAEAKSFIGYIKPAALKVPQAGGDVLFQYTPVTYTIRSETHNISAEYDEAFSVPAESRKGYRFKYYVVSSV